MSAFIEFLNRTSQVLLGVDPDGRQKLAELEGKILCINITIPPLTIFLEPSSDGLKIKQQCETEPDVTLTGSAMAFAKLGTAGIQSRALSDGQVTMQGDAEAGQAFQKILSQLDIDWEELLSQYIGDTPARKVGNAARGFGGWATESMDLSMKNTTEYFQEEKRVLVTNLAMEKFQISVNELRADTDRLVQRIAKLKQKLDSKS